MDKSEQQSISLEQFSSLLSHKQLAIYKKKEEFELEMREYYELCENLVNFALNAEKKIEEFANENAALKKQLTELQEKGN